MTAATLSQPLTGDGSGSATAATDVLDRPTLEELLLGVWEDLSGHQTVTCPVCGGEMAPRYGAGAGALGGGCRRCASIFW